MSLKTKDSFMFLTTSSLQNTAVLVASNIVVHAAVFGLYLQDAWDLFKASMFYGRSLGILLMHWLLHAYGILALIDTSHPVLTGCLMLLVPMPYVSYTKSIITTLVFKRKLAWFVIRDHV